MFIRLWSRCRQFLSYWLEAVDAHSLHSPFIFDLYTGSILDRRPAAELSAVEKLRAKLLEDQTSIRITDLGTGSLQGNDKLTTLGNLAQKSHNPQVSRLLFNLARAYRPKNILELGTNLGLSTLHMAAGAPQAAITSLEGCPKLCEYARRHFEQLGASTVQILPGPIEENLKPFLSASAPLDMIFLDANHRYQPTMNYFNHCLERVHDGSVVIVDDIHWSEEMSRAWRDIRCHQKISISVDLFKVGLLFFDQKLKRNHYILQY